MGKRKLVALAGALVITVFISIFWHVTLFETAYQNLGVYTRMDNPIYQFGMIAWLMESVALVLIFFQTKWMQQGISGGLKFAWLMAIFSAGASVMGSAAKTQISDLTQWFLLGGGYLFVHYTLLGLMLGMVFKRASIEEEKL